ncbi:hypothetical protein [Aurantimonas sp. VKM B-3413]|uniref:hypothetical protein n=1 Tax=Aurantimonas sp. VKM B-3413 TaxID=2779401 RepID=UPI001E3392CB|nr:hypothetical protein [Aurantimonas sp. VKM B-3413]MCB8836169.1 hypothetical protein [Aurantimonas sp. VKM B-3413]
MAKNLKKFVNPKFTRTADLGLLSRLFERHRDALDGLDLGIFRDAASQEAARSAVQDFFAGPEDQYPEGLVADLHRIAELGNAAGLDLILQQAARLGTRLNSEASGAEPEAHQDPKHVALRVFLDHPDVFNAASDMMALMARTSLAEFVGRDEGVEAVTHDSAKGEFETAAAAMFEQDLRSNHCRAGWYDDADELVLVIEHGSPITTTDVLHKDKKRVISFRAAEHAVLSYNSATGLLKIGGVAKARRADLAELFADKILSKPGFFAGDDAQNLYTLDPVQRTGFGFAFNHDFDPGIHRVQITEVQVDRVGADPKTGETRTFYSYVARDGRDNALMRLGEMMRGTRLGSDWRINHIAFRVHFATGGKSAKKVIVKLKPPAHAMFKRQQFEGRIMTLLRRNGLLNDRDAFQAAVAAE